MNYIQTLVITLNKEKAAFKLYIGLSDAEQTEEIRNLFLLLTQEETGHKL